MPTSTPTLLYKYVWHTDGATVLLMERDQIETYEGVDRKGELIKGNMLANYLLNLFLEKELQF